MEEVKEEVQTKPEVKEEEILPLIESGIKSESNLTVIKTEDNEFLDALVNIDKEEKSPVKVDCETEPSIITSLVPSWGGVDEDDLSLKKMNAKRESIKKGLHEEKLASRGSEVDKEGDSEENFEDGCPEVYESDGQLQGDVRGLVVSQNICDCTSTTPSLNQVQKKKVYLRERKHVCRYCDKKFPQSDVLRRHIRTHTGERPYECTYCSKRYISKGLLNRHRLNHTGKPFGCSVCKKYFLQSQGLKQHMLIHEGRKPFRCYLCKMDFRQKVGLVRHIKCVHNRGQQMEEKPMDSEARFKCNDCGKMFKKRDALLMHLKHFHIQGQCRYYCRICGYSSNKKSNLKLHEQLHENKYCFKCDLCNISFKQKNGLKSHFLSAHNSEKPYKCLECASSFKFKSNLTAHIEVRHKDIDKKFSCHICNAGFNRKCYLNRHRETHTGADKKYVCDDCGLGCRSKTDIAKHVLTHLGAVERRHVCQICGAKFSKNSHLVRHQNVHSDKKLFPCKLCDKGYKDPQSLKIHHETVHCGASFSCETCGYTCRNRRTLSRHRKQCQL